MVPSSPTHRIEAMYPAVRQLASTAHRQGAEPVLFMTWGRRDGFPETGHASFVSMQGEITTAYTEIADEVGARVAPVGEAWASTSLSAVRNSASRTRNSSLIFSMVSNSVSRGVT